MLKENLTNRSKKAALIVIDVQNDYCSPNGAMDKLGKNLEMIEGAMDNLKFVLTSFRERQLPIIFVKTVHSSNTDSLVWKQRLLNAGDSAGICRDKWGQDFYQIRPRENEPVVIKHRYSAFVGTNLDILLNSMGINTLLLCGFITNVCVEGTARDGFMRDYNVLTLSDCTASYEKQEYLSAIHNLNTYFGNVVHSRELLNKNFEKKDVVINES
ncbi:cysteine hydrolase family protein [Halalkalibacterium ligniniphilum]|uniref:cysteine hydrolase family protein n=1 Tax=Halalkalibacterium ligniniphilum TaxID=1134413 RepID=UPI0003449748|nr:cysteine hydrolase [Halalkalibacterium ligniniphilum]